MGLRGFFDDAGDLIAEGFETFGELLTNPKFTMVRSEAKNMAQKYNLSRGDKAEIEAFEELWALVTKGMLLAHAEHDAMVDEVNRQVALLPRLAEGAPPGSTLGGNPTAVLRDNAGLGLVHSAELDRNFVIFSDHHMLNNGHRQNFFGTSGNLNLYVEILSRYYGPGGYVLVENGDVEELLIFEPELHEVENIWRWKQKELTEYRGRKKRPLLRKIVQSNRRYYDAVVEHFETKRRYVKITGNHDRDMSHWDYAGIVSEELGQSFPLACDALVLRQSGRVEYIVCHGHQFDTTCTPKYAARAGENFSQGSGWAMQGPDRYWRRGIDQIGEWLTSKRPFANNLVSDQIDDSGFLEWVSHGGTSLQDLVDVAGKLIGNLNTERGWENLYSKPIAWEYFENAGDPQKAINKEVETGDRWFKLRHLNEIRIVDGLEKVFGRQIPTLVLGHSHEPRLRPMRVGGSQIDFYVNSGAAGRFENLIWAIEIVDGEPLLVSWHRGTGEEEQPIRTTWRPGRVGIVGVLTPDEKANIPDLLAALEPVEEPEERADTRGALIAAEQVL